MANTFRLILGGLCSLAVCLYSGPVVAQVADVAVEATVVEQRPAAVPAKTTASGSAQEAGKPEEENSIESRLQRLDAIRSAAARARGEQPPAAAQSQRKLQVMIETPHFGGVQVYNRGQNQMQRFLAFQMVLINLTEQPVVVKREQVRLRVDEETHAIEHPPENNQVSYQSFRVGNQYHQVRNLKVFEELTVPAGGEASSWVVFSGLSAGASVPKLVLEINAETQQAVADLNDYARGTLDLTVERIGPRRALGLLTIGGRLDTLNLASVIGALEELTQTDSSRAVIRWTESAEELDREMLNWIKQSAATAGSDNPQNVYSSRQFALSIPGAIRELHLAGIPNERKQNRRTARRTTTLNTRYGPVQVDLEASSHETEVEAVSAALHSAYRNLSAEEIIREIESGHPLTRAAALAGGGGRLAEEKLPVLLRYADHKDPRMRKAALVALGGVGREEAIEKLVAYTRHKEDEIARIATDSLAGSRFATAHRALLEVYKSGQGPAADVLIAALARHPRPLFRETIFEMARELAGETSIEALKALSRIGHPKLTGLLERALEHEESKIREEAFKLLLARPEPESEALAMEYTLEHLKTSPPTSQMQSLLTRVKDPRAVPLLLEHLRKSKGRDAGIINLLAQIGDQSVAEVFVEMYPEIEQAGSKGTILTALQQLQAPAYRKLAGEALLEKDNSLVNTACRVLQSDAGPEAVRLLVNAYEKTTERNSWNYIGNALGVIGTAEARSVLMKARTSEDEQKRQSATNSLRYLNQRSPGYQYTYQGNNYRQREQWDQAIKYYSIAIAIDPDYSEAYSGRGLAYIRKGGKGKEAREDFLKAEKLDPYNRDAVAYAALMVADQGKYDEAIERIEKARERFEQDKGYAFHAARVYGKAVKWLQEHPEALGEDVRQKRIAEYRKKSIEELQRAYKLGFDNKKWTRNTRDLEPIRDLPEYKKLVGEQEADSKPQAKPSEGAAEEAPQDSPARPE